MSYALPTPPIFSTSGSVGPAGPPGAAGSTVEEFLPFAYGDATPSLIGTALAGKAVLSVQLFITTPFNGTGATLSVGTLAAPAELMATTENNPAADGEYSVYTEKVYGVDTDLYLSIVPGSGAGAGAGFVLVKMEP